jgi:hypothetical protein
MLVYCLSILSTMHGHTVHGYTVHGYTVHGYTMHGYTVHGYTNIKSQNKLAVTANTRCELNDPNLHPNAPYSQCCKVM